MQKMNTMCVESKKRETLLMWRKDIIPTIYELSNNSIVTEICSYYQLLGVQDKCEMHGNFLNGKRDLVKSGGFTMIYWRFTRIY